MAKIKIEITEENGVKMGAEDYDLGDRVSADSDKDPVKYERFCAAVNHGWAKNVDTGETGVRKPGAAKLNVDPVVQQQG